jgi:hypothetical protein
VSLVDVCNSLSEVVLGTHSVVNTLESEDSLIDVLLDFGSEWWLDYLLKERNLALTQSLTCLPGPALAIFFDFWATAAAYDIWFFN